MLSFELSSAIRQFLNPEFRIKDITEIRKIVYDHGSEENPDDFSRDVNKGVEIITNFIRGKMGL